MQLKLIKEKREGKNYQADGFKIYYRYKNMNTPLLIATIILILFLLLSIIMYFINESQMYRLFPIFIGIWIITKLFYKKK